MLQSFLRLFKFGLFEIIGGDDGNTHSIQLVLWHEFLLIALKNETYARMPARSRGLRWLEGRQRPNNDWDTQRDFIAVTMDSVAARSGEPAAFDQSAYTRR